MLNSRQRRLHLLSLSHTLARLRHILYGSLSWSSCRGEANEWASLSFLHYPFLLQCTAYILKNRFKWSASSKGFIRFFLLSLHFSSSFLLRSPFHVSKFAPCGLCWWVTERYWLRFRIAHLLLLLLLLLLQKSQGHETEQSRAVHTREQATPLHNEEWTKRGRAKDKRAGGDGLSVVRITCFRDPISAATAVVDWISGQTESCAHK